jgi:cation-transporting ATPase 13A2
MKLPCDAILLSGSSLVNESMLTGESIPVMKNALPPTTEIYNLEDCKKYTLFGGTEVIQSRYYGDKKVVALVIRTSFVTTKGGLIRSILYPKATKFRFYTDSLKFILFMSIIAVGGFLFFLPHFISEGTDPSVIVDRSLDLLTITVPPALPAAMTVGMMYSLSRLKKKKIFCISPPRINVAGRVNLMVFDKTGTLTEDGLNVHGFRTVESVISTKE